jgi:hypothetical protein
MRRVAPGAPFLLVFLREADAGLIRLEINLKEKWTTVMGWTDSIFKEQ